VAAATYSVTVKKCCRMYLCFNYVTINATSNTCCTNLAATLQPTCAVATGTITVSAPTEGITYSIDGSTYTTTGIFTNVAAATYSVTVKMLQDVSLFNL
jgi:hypothetical protein